jgi:SIR2-like domain
MTDGTAQDATQAPADQWEDHYQAAVRAMLAGRLTPFLGAGANLCGRLPLDEWEPHLEHLPSGGELARYLATEFDYPYPGEHEDLVRISQFISIMDGPGPLMDTLHDLFDADYPPTQLHSFLAGIPALMRASERPVRYQMIVTTNYDDALERAFVAKEEPYDLVSYMVGEPYEGRFVHWPPGETEGRVIDNPQEYIDISPQERTVILKIHGLVDRVTPEREWDSFVITEDHYIAYLTRTDISRFLPPRLIDRFKRSNFLFLGYSLRDWNLRAILQRIWQEQRGEGYTNWAVLLNPEKIDKESWEKRNVQVIEVPLDEYVNRIDGTLRRRLGATEPV